MGENSAHAYEQEVAVEQKRTLEIIQGTRPDHHWSDRVDYHFKQLDRLLTDYCVSNEDHYKLVAALTNLHQAMGHWGDWSNEDSIVAKCLRFLGKTAFLEISVNIGLRKPLPGNRYYRVDKCPTALAVASSAFSCIDPLEIPLLQNLVSVSS